MTIDRQRSAGWAPSNPARADGIWAPGIAITFAAAAPSRGDDGGFPSPAAGRARLPTHYWKIRAGTESRLAPQSGEKSPPAALARNRDRDDRDARRPPLSRCNWQASSARQPSQQAGHRSEFQETFPIHAFAA